MLEVVGLLGRTKGLSASFCSTRTWVMRLFLENSECLGRTGGYGAKGWLMVGMASWSITNCSQREHACCGRASDMVPL
jgi:hypothetical protein